MFSDKLKALLKDRKRSLKDLAEEMGKTPQTLYNAVHMEGKETPKTGKPISIQYSTVEEMCDLLGCDIVFRDRETGKIYE